MDTYFHSVTLDEQKCRGCTNCIKRCPTEAIRVRKSKARIINERCIDCGECIRVCPYHAKKAITDPFEMIAKYKYCIALPAPSFYAQFKAQNSRNTILNALKAVGFDDVFEVAKAAEIVTCATRELLLHKDVKKPLISSACPAVVKLIQVRFPNLIGNIVRLDSPMDLAGRIAREEAIKRTGLPSNDIGIFFISPCAAKATVIKAPYDKKKANINGAIAIKDIFLKVLHKMEKVEYLEHIEQAGNEGLGWACPGGESGVLGTDKYLSVDGIHNIITILEEVENDRLEDVDFIEALSCVGGCLGGPLTVENVYVAKTQLKKQIDRAKPTRECNFNTNNEAYKNIEWSGNIKHKPVMKLDDDMSEAMKKLEALENINDELPGLDCGACGAPSCRALAEDIVRGIANETDCIFKLRDKVRGLARQMMELEGKLPPVMDKEVTKNIED